MAVSPADKERMARLTQHLRQAETDLEPATDARAARIDAANAWREAHGRPPLVEDTDDEPPELELFRRARALGIGDRRR